MEKTYLCHMWPELTIRKMRFRSGVYRTADPDEQALIEGNEVFGVHIFEMKTGDTRPEVGEARVRQGARGSNSLV